MAPTVVAKSGMGRMLVSRLTMPMPVPTPATATPMGRPMAITEPNARISTITAKPRPMASVCGGSNPAR